VTIKISILLKKSTLSLQKSLIALDMIRLYALLYKKGGKDKKYIKKHE